MESSTPHISIDRFGRIVLPKEIRDRRGITSGTEFEVEETDDSILLRPIVKKAKVTKKQGLMVVELGEPMDRDLIRETLEKTRQERASRCW